jgi:hypothetical protein
MRNAIPKERRGAMAVVTSAIEVEEGFCFDHGYHLGPRCPRCYIEIDEPLQG